MTEKAIKKNVWQMPESLKYLQRNLVLDNGHFIGPGSEKKWYSAENSPQGAWDRIADETLLEFEESGHPISVKSIPPTTENWLRKLYTCNKKNYMSTEDKHETNHINNKYNDTNTDTRKMHNL